MNSTHGRDGVSKILEDMNDQSKQDANRIANALVWLNSTYYNAKWGRYQHPNNDTNSVLILEYAQKGAGLVTWQWQENESLNMSFWQLLTEDPLNSTSLVILIYRARQKG